jgi:uncharacterized protein YjbI with pentapeptide repeats
MDLLRGIADSLRDFINRGLGNPDAVDIPYEKWAYTLAAFGVVIAVPLSALEVSLTIYRRYGRQARRFGRQMVRVLLLLSAVALLAILLAGVFVVPNYLFTRELGAPAIDQLEPAELLQAKNNIRTTTIQAFGGLALLIGAFFTGRQLWLTREGQVTERFSKAIDQLGSDEPNVRLGAIHALVRISRNSRADRSAVVEILTEYIRSRSPWPPPKPRKLNILSSVRPASRSRSDNGRETFPTDVQVVMALLARRRVAMAANQAVTLSGVSLRGVNLPKAYLQRVDFRGSDLRQTNLSRADLWRSNFEDASLQEATLERANFQRSDLNRANLEGARLVLAIVKKADLRQSRLVEANLRGAILDGSNLQGADFRLAHLRGASFSATRLVGTTFDGADLREASFARANAWFGGPRTDSLLKNASNLWASIWARSPWAGSYWATSEWGSLARLKGSLAESSFTTPLEFYVGGFVSTWAVRYLGRNDDSEAPLVSFRGCDLRKAKFHGSYFPRADLEDAKLDRAKLVGVDLNEARLTGATLRRVTLDGARLRGAQLQGVDMQGVRRGRGGRSADLRGADLRGADLRGADLRDADLRDADLRGADLRDIRWQSLLFHRHSVLFEAASADSKTQWPANLNPDHHGVTVHKDPV